MSVYLISVPQSPTQQKFSSLTNFLIKFPLLFSSPIIDLVRSNNYFLLHKQPIETLMKLNVAKPSLKACH